VRNVLIGILGVSFAMAPVAADQVETVDAGRVTGRVQSLSAERVVIVTDKGPRTLALDDVLEISLAEAPDAMTTAGMVVVRTATGDVLVGKDVAFDGKVLRIACDVLGRVELAMDTVRAVYLPTAEKTPADVDGVLRELKLPAATGDRVLVARPGKQALAIDGVLESIGPGKIRFRWKDRSRTIARATVRLVALAAVGDVAQEAKGTLRTTDGSKVHYAELSADGKSFVVVSAALGKWTISRDHVAGVRLASANVVNLADLKPDAVREYGYFGTTFRHRVNRSVSGRGLRLAGRTYRSGLGLHSFCELTYRLDGQYAALVATVGIDDAARPGGDATLTFLGDGKPLGKAVRLTGKDDPKPVRVALAGVKTLLVRVGFGEDDLGHGDHVNLAGARLLRQVEKKP